VEQGSHQQLLDARGHYYELYNSQFSGGDQEQAALLGTSEAGTP
jgi:ATP-binding cassette subfamily B protein